jgi:hypothetical protein
VGQVVRTQESLAILPVKGIPGQRIVDKLCQNDSPLAILSKSAAQKLVLFRKPQIAPTLRFQGRALAMASLNVFNASISAISLKLSPTFIALSLSYRLIFLEDSALLPTFGR